MKINLVAVHIEDSPLSIPLGIGMIKAALCSNKKIRKNTEVTLFEYYPKNTPEEIADVVIATDAKMSGFSIYLWNRDCILKAVAIIRKEKPGMIIFGGGSEASADPEGLIGTNLFDFIVRGEGECVTTDIVTRILDKKDYTHLPGVYTKHGKCNLPALPPDLSKIPSPYRMNIINPSIKKSVLWELSRGCPFKCGFCFESRNISGVRFFDIGRLKKELKIFVKSGVVQIFVLDPTFNFDKKRAKKLLKHIASVAPHIHFTFEVRVEFIDEEMVLLFKKINCSLQIGLQSSSLSVLSAVNRKMDHSLYKKNVSLLNKHGVIFGLDLIYGLPFDTMKSFMESLDFAINLRPNHLDIFPLAVLPGTDISEKALDFKLDYLKVAPYTIISTPWFSVTDMDRAGKLQVAVNIFYNSGAVSWFDKALEATGSTASEYLEKIASFCDKIPDEPNEIHIRFLSELLIKADKKSLFLPLKDLVLFHSAMNKTSLCECGVRPLTEAVDDDSVLALSECALLVVLNYNPDNLLEIGNGEIEDRGCDDKSVISLKVFVEVYTAGIYPTIVYKHKDGGRWLTVSENYYQILKQIDGVKKLSSLYNGVIDDEDLLEFINYCIEERILISSKN